MSQWSDWVTQSLEKIGKNQELIAGKLDRITAQNELFLDLLERISGDWMLLVIIIFLVSMLIYYFFEIRLVRKRFDKLELMVLMLRESIEKRLPSGEHSGGES